MVIFHLGRPKIVQCILDIKPYLLCLIVLYYHTRRVSLHLKSGLIPIFTGQGNGVSRHTDKTIYPQEIHLAAIKNLYSEAG